MRWLLTCAIATLTTTALLACSAPPRPPPQVPTPPPEEPYEGALCPYRYPGGVFPFGRRAIFLFHHLSKHYYGLACSHPATRWHDPGLEEIERTADALEEALARRGRDLRDHSLQMVGVSRPREPNAEPTPHIYVRGDACADDENWMAPSPARSSCAFDALYDLNANDFVVLELEPDNSCLLPPPSDELLSDAERCRLGIGDELLSDAERCRLGIGGELLRIGRGTFLPGSPPRVCTRGYHRGREFFVPDEESVRAAMRAVGERLAASPPDRWSGRTRRLDDYWMQAMGESSPYGRIVYVTGSCAPFLRNAWIEECLTHVSDGGDCYFHAFYDLAREKLVQFSFHGDA